ncbi:MAG: site-specific DNA-methyltransferase [Ruminococcus sp.]|nr:site-specific DNA-methyltransferase [Ruminococcus sp.]MBQ8297339.1 site-specific DNA-methyltransferase [Ruminococcus sp.]
MRLYNGNCLEALKTLPAKSIGLILTDPPYNIGKAEWDKIENYVEWCGEWLTECQRVLKDNGTLIFWHNDITLSSELLHWISKNTDFVLNSFGLWHKPNFRKLGWSNKSGECTLRSWFNVFEFFFVFINPTAGREWKKTGLDYVYSTPECFKPLKEWYHSELKRLNITKQDIYAKYTEVTGKKPYMPARHYFKDSQFEIPTQSVYESVYIPLGFNKSYEELRPTFNIFDGETYSNYFTADKQNCSNAQLHPCRKPLNILAKLIKTHSRENEIVLDCFMGSGSTGEAAVNLNRDFIGIELDKNYFSIAKDCIENAIKAKNQEDK